MAVSGSNISIEQDSGSAKLHPYLVALVRWCVSCLWSTATVLLHRMMIKPIPQIAGAASKLSKPRPAGREHLHPEPKVECVVLHQPQVHNLDVIFVHGLYGSLCNTWRQGEWRSKYQSSPEKVHLRRPTATPAPCTCPHCDKTNKSQNSNNPNSFNEQNSLRQTKNNFSDETSMVYYSEKDNKYVYEEKNECDNRVNIDVNFDDQFNKETNYDYDDNDAFKKIDNDFYEDLRKILPNDEVFTTEKFYNNTLIDQVEIIENYETQAQFVSDLFKNCDNSCNRKEDTKGNEHFKKNCERSDIDEKCLPTHDNCVCTNKECEVGCGCNCDSCYSPCWPKDWVKVDYPDARVISINYTSDPHLWRPIWIKENKRLCLHERAEQMTEQLLNLDVGQRPVMWVGHSKGGLFIKQIYCEAYEAYLKLHPENNQSITKQSHQESQEQNSKVMNNTDSNSIINNLSCSINEQNKYNKCTKDMNVTKEIHDSRKPTSIKAEDDLLNNRNENMLPSSYIDEEILRRRASLWHNSSAFMFYSVPHRGSPLADIKIPIAARSIELMEISKDNSLVLSLQERWLRATAFSKPLVRSLVETRRTLMSVLWLRIVSTDSADPGIGALCGVSVDHREICKPSSRHCLLYTELSALIKAGLNRFKSIGD